MALILGRDQYLEDIGRTAPRWTVSLADQGKLHEIKIVTRNTTAANALASSACWARGSHEVHLAHDSRGACHNV